MQDLRKLPVQCSKVQFIHIDDERKCAGQALHIFDLLLEGIRPRSCQLADAILHVRQLHRRVVQICALVEIER